VKYLLISIILFLSGCSEPESYTTVDAGLVISVTEIPTSGMIVLGHKSLLKKVSST